MMKKSLMFLLIFMSAFPAFAEEVRSATILSLRGGVEVRKGGQDWSPAQVGMTLYKGDQIKTDDQAFAEVAIDDGATGTVEVDSSSLFKLDTLDLNKETGDKMTLLDLAMGRVLVHAEKLQGKSKFEVKTPTSTAGVRGTTFEVRVAEE